MIRYLNATDSNELNNYDMQREKIEQVQQPFRVKRSNAWHIGTFVYDEHYSDWIVNFTQN